MRCWLPQCDNIGVAGRTVRCGGESGIGNALPGEDQGEKARRYAMNGYPEYWVADHVGKVVHVHRDPRPDGTWASVTTAAHGPLPMLAAPDITIDVDELFTR